jgi:site-specific DNA-cytosine methylase
MKTIELYAGTRSFSKVALEYGYQIFTTDYEEIDGQDLVADIRTLTVKDFPYKPDVVWASPPCEGFSVASIGANWTGGKRGYIPKSDSARNSIDLAKQAIRLIKELNPKYWFIENPRGLLRKMPFMEKFVSEMGGGTTYCLVLPIR